MEELNGAHVCVEMYGKHTVVFIIIFFLLLSSSLPSYQKLQRGAAENQSFAGMQKQDSFVPAKWGHISGFGEIGCVFIINIDIECLEVSRVSFLALQFGTCTSDNRNNITGACNRRTFYICTCIHRLSSAPFHSVRCLSNVNFCFLFFFLRKLLNVTALLRPAMSKWSLDFEVKRCRGEAGTSLGWSDMHLPSQMFCWIKIIRPIGASKWTHCTKATPTCSVNSATSLQFCLFALFSIIPHLLATQWITFIPWLLIHFNTLLLIIT